MRMQGVRRIRAAGLASLVALLLTGAAGAAPLTVTILHNNDGESALFGSGSFGGAARFVTLVEQERAAAAAKGPVLTLSSGDNFLAGAVFNVSVNDGVFYDARVLNAIGYDAIILGNHDFDFGPETLAQFIGQVDAAVPYVSANLDYTNEASLDALASGPGQRLFASVVVEKDGQKFGIVGATTPDLGFISSPGQVGVGQDILGIVQAEVDDLINNQGVDKIIVVTHLQAVENEIALVQGLRGVDVVIAGGGDDLLANDPAGLIPGDVIEGPYPTIVQDADGRDVPIVTTAGEYKYLGKLEVTFDDATGEIVSINAGSGPVRVSGVAPDAVAPDPDVVANVIDPVNAGIAGLAANIVADTEVPLDGIRNNVRTRETNLGNLVADALLSEAQRLAGDFGAPQPVIALQNGGSIRNNSILPAGDLSEKTTIDVLPFANFLAVVPDVSPQDLKRIIENAVSRVELQDGRFAQIAGFKVVYDPSRQALVLDADGNVVTPGARIVSIVLDDGTVIVKNGRVAKNAPAVTIATLDFLARGGDQYFFGQTFTVLGETYQQALFNYLSETLGGLVLASDPRYASALGEGRTSVGRLVVAEPAATLGLLPLALGGIALMRRRQKAATLRV